MKMVWNKTIHFYKFIIMTLAEQIEYTEKELKSHEESEYSSIVVIEWLRSVLESLKN